MGQEASALKVGEMFSQLWNRKYTDPLAGQLGLPVDVLLEESIWLLHKSKSYFRVLPAQCELVAGSGSSGFQSHKLGHSSFWSCVWAGPSMCCLGLH